MIKVTVGFPVWVGVLVFVWGRKCFGAWCAKNENGGSCMTLVKIIFIPRLRYNMLAS